MTTIQDRIIKSFRKQFYYDEGLETFCFNLPAGSPTKIVTKEEHEQFLIKSIKEVEEETRKEMQQEIAELKIKVIDLTNHCKNL